MLYIHHEFFKSFPLINFPLHIFITFSKIKGIVRVCVVTLLITYSSSLVGNVSGEQMAAEFFKNSKTI